MKAPGFWYRPAGRKAALLSPLGAVYGGLGRLRQRLVKPWPAGVPVVCVGNLTVGGAGKTPLAIALAGRLAEAGLRPHFLTRGYRGRLCGPVQVDLGVHDAGDVGDEALLLAAHFPTWVSGDRVAGARSAVAAGAGALVMDDGFQNPALAKDVSIVAVDGGTGFGNGRIVPAGPLRETPRNGLARADAVVLVGDDDSNIAPTLAGMVGPRGRLPLLRARFEPEPSARRFRDASVVAFAGIARPAKFFATLEKVGARLVARFAYPDHHRYNAEELMQMAELADAADALLVTTAKDYARLPDDARLLVRVVAIRAVWEDPAALDAVLAPALTGGPSAAA
jgi:tetraacyldisaccharide 4'-kinase